MRFLAGLFLLLLLSSAAQAQATWKCGSFDTNTSASAQFPVLGICNITTGPNGIIYATANSEQSCSTGSIMGVQLFVGAGTSPITGVNFGGSISSGQLTVTALTGAFGNGTISSLSITNPGAGGTTAGSYPNVASTGGSGATSAGTSTLAKLNVTVTGASGSATVTGVSPNNSLATYSIGYHVGDVLSVASGLIGGVSGFTATVTAVQAPSPWNFQNGQTVTGPEFSKQTATITSQASSSLPGGDLGMLGVYNISDATVTGTSAGTDAFALPPIPGGMTSISPHLHMNGCVNGYATTAVAGSFVGTPNSNYYLVLMIDTDVDGHTGKWNNSGIIAFTW